MNSEFHYYSIFLIAKAVGFNDGDANILAYSSQYVDDNNKSYRIFSYEGARYCNAKSAIENLHDIKEDGGILQTFHFLPGDNAQHKKMVTRNSKASNAMLEKAIEQNDLYHLGIALHAYADTWAHENFSALNEDVNAGKGFLKSLIPNIGHADYGVAPDLIGVKWYDCRHNKWVDNNEKFLECAAAIFDVLSNRFVFEIKTSTKNELLDQLKLIYGHSTSWSIFKQNIKSRKRIKAYIQYARDEFGSDLQYYHSNQWFEEAVMLRGNEYYFKDDTDYTYTNWYQFQKAIKSHFKV